MINVTLNGQTLPAPEPDGRQVKLDDLPSGMIQAVTVTKSLLASQDANAIGGEVDDPHQDRVRQQGAVLPRRARRGAAGTIINGKSPYELDGTIGGRFGQDEQFGAVVSVNYSRAPDRVREFPGVRGLYGRRRSGRQWAARL